MKRTEHRGAHTRELERLDTPSRRRASPGSRFVVVAESKRAKVQSCAPTARQAGGVSPEGNAYCAVGRPRSALWSAAISRNGRGSQDRRPRVITLVCQSPPYVGRGGKLACPRTAAPVISQTDHQRDRRAPPRGARRATSAAGRWGPLQSRNASLTLPTLAPLAPRRCTARANAPPPPVEQRVVPPCCLARPAPAPTSCRV